MAVDTKAGRIKETISTGETATRKELDTIITRLKQKQSPLARAPGEEMKELSFKNITIKNQPGFLGQVGSFYSMFTGPLNSVASLLAKMPSANNLRNTLDSAEIYLSVEAYLVVVASVSLMLSLVFLLLFGLLGLALLDVQLAALSPVIAICIFGLGALGGLIYPSVKAGERASDIDRTLPFALRQLSTQVRAGVSFYKALVSISNSKYGVLSSEIRIVIRDMDSGLSTEEALMHLHARTKSEGLRKAIMQIIRSMRTGGNLSQIISDIADDVSFETRMSIRDFTEKLNFINIIYIMVSVVAPVALAIMSAIMQIPIFAGGIPPVFILIGFMGVLFVMFIILFVIKRIEPAVW